MRETTKAMQMKHLIFSRLILLYVFEIDHRFIRVRHSVSLFNFFLDRIWCANNECYANSPILYHHTNWFVFRVSFIFFCELVRLQREFITVYARSENVSAANKFTIIILLLLWFDTTYSWLRECHICHMFSLIEFVQRREFTLNDDDDWFNPMNPRNEFDRVIDFIAMDVKRL